VTAIREILTKPALGRARARGLALLVRNAFPDHAPLLGLLGGEAVS
jgi:hypothetical protein